ncbi:XrtA system polysaccharide deacetylase [Engelhardtia mirabilis]|uniref:Peptidoglycan deacetylase n=1 Tax=Engelhardtia mirabilis TaxID=2528011 RepID=A0A518BKC8_9BACT|nr:Peptidoglycan deacetylase [Planctomycetes bacterium Pla133]QDV01758.1 Peptidoglycan deacetylase [Planctomycetes bacterium Pla86]
MTDRTMTDRLHALSFDVEEFFQVANLRGQFDRDDWESAPSRIDVGMDAILGALDRNRARATFFFLGWVAEQRPDLVRRCLDAGHEIASHGYEHLFLWDLGPEGLETDLARTEEALMAAGAPRPLGFRASTFTLTRRTFWALDVLARRGYAYDSSIHPVSHPVYGIPDFEPGISRVAASDGTELVEFPVSTLRALGRNLPVGGGGYFRLLPGFVTRGAVARLEASGRPASIYLHPWEFDPQQPRYPAPVLKKFRHYLNLDRTLPRLEALLARFRFAGLAEVLAAEGWLEAAPNA